MAEAPPPPPPQGDPTVIFLHIGKTAGATVRRVLQRNVPPSRVMRIRNPISAEHGFLSDEPIRAFAGLSAEARARPRLIMSHMMFGLHEHVPRPATYITLFRHPVARVLSGYKNVRRHGEHRFHEMVVSQDMSLEDYVRSGVALELDNSLMRALLGDVETPYGACTAGMLERAKAVMDRHFAVVGLSERLDESLVLLGRTFGWRNIFYVSTNVSPVRLTRDDQPTATIAAIEELNRFDLELYAYADARMRAQVEACEGFSRDLDRFRRGNRLYRRWADVTYTWPRALRRR